MLWQFMFAFERGLQAWGNLIATGGAFVLLGWAVWQRQRSFLWTSFVTWLLVTALITGLAYSSTYFLYSTCEAESDLLFAVKSLLSPLFQCRNVLDLLNNPENVEITLIPKSSMRYLAAWLGYSAWVAVTIAVGCAVQNETGWLARLYAIVTIFVGIELSAFMLVHLVTSLPFLQPPWAQYGPTSVLGLLGSEAGLFLLVFKGSLLAFLGGISWVLELVSRPFRSAA